jgi:polyhydroxybutyrate depolymerase
MNRKIHAMLAAVLLFTGAPAAVLGAGSPGCRLDSSPQGGTFSMKFDGLERVYRVHVPSSYSNAKPAPLVIAFHGWGGDENDYLDISLVRKEADRRGFIIVAPRGIGSGAPDGRNNSWSFRGSTSGIDGDGNPICDLDLTPEYTYPSCKEAGIAKNHCAWTHCQGKPGSDVDFTLALLERIGARFCVDTGRIYATGSSNGGMYTWELGQNPASAPLFRAIAPNIGLPHRGYADGPGQVHGMPVLLTTGTLDRTVPPGEWENAGYTTTSDVDRFYYTSATAITRVWAEAVGCATQHPAQPVDTGIEGLDCRSYCPAGEFLPPVLDCRAEMGHESGFSWSWGLTLDFFDHHGE